MAKVTHLDADCSVADIIEVVEAEGAVIVDCGGQVLAPGLIDMRVFTGEPGEEHKETLQTASIAAAAGGVTTMVVMPRTNPVIDDVALVGPADRIREHLAPWREAGQRGEVGTMLLQSTNVEALRLMAEELL